MLWKTKRGHIDLSDRAQIMGILNVTPDSFSDGGQHISTELALSHAELMIAQGASIIDIGGESTRPGSLPVTLDEEKQRTIPVIRALRTHWDGWISIDTSKAEVAAAALAAGADIVNDVSGLRADPQMPLVCAQSQCAIVVMHMQGQPRHMQEAPIYEDIIQDISLFFQERYTTLKTLGIHPDCLCFDPGIGFGKTLEHNLTILRSIDQLNTLHRPLLLGVSRKSLIAGILGDSSLHLRDWPTVAITAFAREKGIMLHRVHSVVENLHALRMTEAILSPSKP